MFVWFVYATKSQRATAQSLAATSSRDKVTRKNRRDKIAGVTPVLRRTATAAAAAAAAAVTLHSIAGGTMRQWVSVSSAPDGLIAEVLSVM